MPQRVARLPLPVGRQFADQAATQPVGHRAEPEPGQTHQGGQDARQALAVEQAGTEGEGDLPAHRRVDRAGGKPEMAHRAEIAPQLTAQCFLGIGRRRCLVEPAHRVAHQALGIAPGPAAVAGRWRFVPQRKRQQPGGGGWQDGESSLLQREFAIGAGIRQSGNEDRPLRPGREAVEPVDDLAGQRVEQAIGVAEDEQRMLGIEAREVGRRDETRLAGGLPAKARVAVEVPAVEVDAVPAQARKQLVEQ
ncbi:MAG: hypothetical protein CAPSK01_003135 [Candidatus Accumulibacter vicinus]|uniref:Uncharacterized protein n=1 Tax=Candidatus Accumulibacter vicinus TaxID=2954382 RepID=A0A084XY33_9PROT|nr:MAG: hypothetical protein CAPSK01_003135 [Candidatus Accumulibacter vicinus]